MRNVKVIIGSGFGDEGKGLFTDYFSASGAGKACVVRFNGGAQAGHSVELADGRRHVFSHFGSGSLAGLPTYLSHFFVHNPIIFLRERNELLALGTTPVVFADPAGPVTTPYDIMINQIVEQARGGARHGSVGVGFGETLERQERSAFQLTLADLKDDRFLRTKLNGIRREWVEQRLAALDVKVISHEWCQRLASEALREKFIEDCRIFLRHINLAPLSSLAGYDDCIFEGAQGLWLDQDHGWFPHVTRSNTGLKNVIALAQNLEIDAMDVFYLTRPYLTRHGAGPLPHELHELPYPRIIDRTNRPNTYQGSLRFAWFNLDLFREAVTRDIELASGRVGITPHLGVSCMDQIDGSVIYIADGCQRTAGTAEFPNIVARSIDAQSALVSYGPTRHRIHSAGSRPNRSIIAGNRLFQPIDIGQNNMLAVVAQ